MSGLILASASVTRQRLLRDAGVDFRVQPADLDEKTLMENLRAQGAAADAIALTLAEQKAVQVSRAHPGQLVLGADSVLAFGQETLGKSPDLAALRALLSRLAGKTHALVSAVVLARDGAALWRHAARVRLTMRAFGDVFLDAYLATEGAGLLSSVGGYRYEERGAQLFEQVEGDYFAVLGLPLLPVLAALRMQGQLAT